MKRIVVQYTWLAVLIILVCLLASCGRVPVLERIEDSAHVEHELEQDSLNTLGNMGSIGTALGCVFAPQSCAKSKATTPQ